jgi:PPOX class probable F420-dependent enzyme
MPLSESERESFLKEARVAVLATVGVDGTPHAVPVWYEYAGGKFYVISGSGAAKVRHIRQGSRASLCVDDRTAPYKAVVVWGKAAISEEGVREMAYRIAQRYLGPQEGAKEAETWLAAPCVIIELTPERLTSWDYGQEG